jgi:hypothetical protein
MTAWLTGVVNKAALKVADHPQLGLLITPDTAQYEKYIRAFRTWAADNACFSQAKPFDPKRWRHWLSNLPRRHCLWATAPDVVGDHRATVKRSSEYLPLIRSMGFPAAFVAQNGAQPDNVPWNDFDALFIGGVLECIPCGWNKPAAADREIKHCPFCGRKLTEWKESEKVLVLVAEAKHRKMPVHVGRVNTARRFRWCRDAAESDTADGTMLARKAPEVGIAEVLGWLDNPQPAMFAG